MNLRALSRSLPNSKRFLAGLLRRTGLPLVLAATVSCAVAPAYAGDAANVSKHEQKQVDSAALAKAVGEASADVQELKERVRELEARERQSYAMELEGQRKTMDWWFSFLAVLTAIMAIFGALIPFLMARKDKEIIEQDKMQIRKLLDEVKGMKGVAESDVKKIHQHEAEAAASKEKLLAYLSGSPSAKDKEIRDAVMTVEQDQGADYLLRLRAEAIAASEAKNANKAYTLWAALSELAADDASAQFNAGYWAHELADTTKTDEKLRWLKLAARHYAQTLRIESDFQEAAFNWGNALDDEAKALFATEPIAARALWKQAGEKYQVVLNLKPDDYDAVNNWGLALLAEAKAVAASDAEYSRQLMDQAEQLLLAHANVAPGAVAYNLACVYGLRGDVQSCLKWLRVAREHKTLMSCEHILKDKDLDPVRNAPEFIEWFSKVCP